MPVTVAPGRVETAGPTGLTRFRHPATVALEDLIYLSVAISDGTAADALFDFVLPAEVTATLRRFGFEQITARRC